MYITQKIFLSLLAGLFILAGAAQFQYIGALIIDSRLWLSWAVVALIVGIGFIIALKKQQLVLPSLSKFVGIYLVLVIIAAIFAPQFNIAVIWEWGGFIAGFLTFVALHQHSDPEKFKINLLKIIFISGIVQAIIGIFQYHNLKLFGYSFYHHNMSVGGFYQRNVMASYLATTLLIVLAIPRQKMPIIVEFAVMLGILIITYSFAITRSLVGSLGLLVGGLLISVNYLKKFKANPEYVKPLISPMIWLALVVVGFFVLPSIFDQKMAVLPIHKKIVDINGIAIGTRITFITSSIKMVIENPLFGKGLGMFAGLMRPYYADVAAVQGTVMLNSIVTHPHNEIAYRMSESGLLGLTGLLLMVGVAFKMLWQLGINRGMLYAGLLVPIAIHTQTELPFYQSVPPWILFMVLLYLPLNHFATTYKIKLQPNYNNILTTLVGGFSLVVTAIMFDKYLMYNPIYKVYEDSMYKGLKGTSFVNKVKPLINDSYYKPVVNKRILLEYMAEASFKKDVATIDKYYEEFENAHKKIMMPPAEFIKISIHLVRQQYLKALSKFKQLKKWYPEYQTLPNYENIVWMSVIQYALNTNTNPSVLKEYEVWAKQSINKGQLKNDYGYSFLVHTLMKLGKNAEAINIVQEAKKLFPNSKILKKWKLTIKE